MALRPPVRRLVTSSYRIGFSLIELLVVIAIVSTLIAVLLPALKRAKIAADIVRCMSNQRQLGVIFYTYAIDNSGDYVQPWVGEVPRTESAYGDDQRDRKFPWPVLLNSYQRAPIGSGNGSTATSSPSFLKYTGLPKTDTSNIYTCPTTLPGWTYFNGWNQGGGGNYTLNSLVFAYWVGPKSNTKNYYGANPTYFGNIDIRRIDRTKYPATTLSFYDGYVNDRGNGTWDATTYTASPYTPASSGSNRHRTHNVPVRSFARYRWHGNDTTNLTLLDGHVKSFNFGRAGAVVKADARIHDDLFDMSRGTKLRHHVITP